MSAESFRWATKRAATYRAPEYRDVKELRVSLEGFKLVTSPGSMARYRVSAGSIRDSTL